MNDNSSDTVAEITTSFFQRGVAESTVEAPPPSVVQSWFTYVSTIDDIIIGYWISPPVVFAVLHRNESGDIEYVICEPEKQFLTDSINQAALHPLVKSYYTRKNESYMGLLHPLKKDRFIDKVILSDGEVQCLHTHSSTDQFVSVSNVGCGFSVDEFVDVFDSHSRSELLGTEGDANTGSATLPDGENIIYSSHDDPSLSLTFTNRGGTTPVELLKNGVYTSTTLAYIWSVIASGKSILIGGVDVGSRLQLIEGVSYFISKSSVVSSYHQHGDYQLPCDEWNEYTQVDVPNGKYVLDLAEDMVSESPDYFVLGDCDVGSVNEFIVGMDVDSVITGVAGGTVSQSLSNYKHVLEQNGDFFIQEKADVVLCHEYVTPEQIDCIGVGEVDAGGSINVLEEAVLPVIDVDVTESCFVSNRSEITARRDVLERLVDEGVTDPREVYESLNEFTYSE
jgi:type IV secretory pathway ATPase VirB11/archaellum biosynthesis ATPase